MTRDASPASSAARPPLRSNGPCHHRNTGRSGTSSDVTALGSALALASTRTRSEHTWRSEAPDPARARHRGPQLALDRRRHDRPQRMRGADVLERVERRLDPLRIGGVDDQVERDRPDAARAVAAARGAQHRLDGREVAGLVVRALTAAATGARPGPGARRTRSGPHEPELVHLRCALPPPLEQRVDELPRALDAVLRG